jgi:hemerythrin
LEERLMRERSYDQLIQHKNDHERLLDELRDIMEDFEASERIDENLLAQSLDAWFSRHFESHDARLHSVLGDH